MPLNYSKWDNLELSDDSDIEGHPNVDKKSLIRWKQRDIHEKREMRKLHIAQLQADIACNEILEPRLHQIVADVEAKGPAEFSSLVERFKTNPSPEKPPTNAPQQITYDEMLLTLMLKVWEEAKKDGAEKDDPRLGEVLVKSLKKHIEELEKHQEKLRKELAQEEAEQKKKITSDDIHEGFESHYVPPKPAPPPVKNAIASGSSSKKTTSTEIEVLNPRGVAASQDSLASSSGGAAEELDENAELPELTPSLEAFSRLPVRGYEQSWEFIKQHRDVVVPGASDALLVAAFTAQSEGKGTYAKQCVHQSLLLQYCDKLGKDGVSIFFKRMMTGDPRALGVFEKDVEDTYAHLCERVRISKAEAEAGQEQIQLMPENPAQSITFNVPDGPPPEHIELEGDLADVNIEDVRRALQMRWDVFQGFPAAFQDALRSQSLDQVNKVLGAMKVDEAEQIVQMLDMAGILSFSEHGVRDETGRGKQGEEEEEDEEEEEEGAGDEQEVD
ncbi:hsp90 co-chaperone Cdc37 [Phanerochaete sordida]|uniref:Hsp90 chaperone protein kinase-targeting subunit n=1 Tax=Phanerochaete sordida TaxID=48140 RepID=A0A9P3G5R7_9APHY|nr:hsp90 co-chaperone Cdc37 [Phanerochaete sordida]